MPEAEWCDHTLVNFERPNRKPFISPVTLALLSVVAMVQVVSISGLYVYGFTCIKAPVRLSARPARFIPSRT